MKDVIDGQRRCRNDEDCNAGKVKPASGASPLHGGSRHLTDVSRCAKYQRFHASSFRSVLAAVLNPCAIISSWLYPILRRAAFSMARSSGASVSAIGRFPKYGPTIFVSWSRSRSQVVSVSVARLFSSHSYATVAKVLARAFFSTCLLTLESAPAATSRRGSSRRSRASPSRTSGCMPSDRGFSTPANRYSKRQSRLPVGVTSQKSPRSSYSS
jgi:hypothetical protein